MNHRFLQILKGFARIIKLYIMEEKIKHTHGGARAGSGRKKLNRKQALFQLDADVIETLNDIDCSKSDFVNAAIRAYASNRIQGTTSKSYTRRNL